MVGLGGRLPELDVWGRAALSRGEASVVVAADCGKE